MREQESPRTATITQGFASAVCVPKCGPINRAQTNMWKTRKKSVRSSVTGNGEIYIGLCTGKERLFAVRLVIKDNSKTTYLDVLNLDYEVESSMVIEPEVFEWSGSYLIADMYLSVFRIRTRQMII